MKNSKNKEQKQTNWKWSDSMNVKELIEQLQKLDQEIEIRICLRNGWRPITTKPIPKLDKVIDQDTNQLGYYGFDVDTSIEYPIHEEKIIMPES